jgi:hypothetical protein
LGDVLPSFSCQRLTVVLNDVLTPKTLSPLHRRRDTQIRATIDRAHILEVRDESRFLRVDKRRFRENRLLGVILLDTRLSSEGGLGEGRLEGLTFGQESVGSGECAANQVLVAVGDVEDCAASGNVYPPLMLVSLLIASISLVPKDVGEMGEGRTYGNC